MYAWIWAHLPGPRPVRAVLAGLLITAALFLCLEIVFPAVDGRTAP